jgi:hypothetical protein
MDNMEVCVSFLDPRELTTVQLGALYTDYGYQVRIVEYGKDESDPESDVRINYDMAASMEWAWREIRKIQSAARSHKPIVKPRWPLIILRSPKGWGGAKHMDGKPIEGSWRSHQGALDIYRHLFPLLTTTSPSSRSGKRRQGVPGGLAQVIQARRVVQRGSRLGPP